jgi:hypothetical protein
VDGGGHGDFFLENANSGNRRVNLRGMSDAMNAFTLLFAMQASQMHDIKKKFNIV